MNAFTDAQIMGALKIERDRLNRYLREAGGNPNGYRVSEIREDVRLLEMEAIRRGLE